MDQPMPSTQTQEGWTNPFDLTVEKLLWQAKKREVVCIRTASGKQVAVKRYNLKDSSQVSQLTIVNEMRVHHSLHQIKTVVEMLGAFQVDDNAYIVTAYHPRGNLLRFMKKLGRALTDTEAVNALVLPLLYTIMRIHSKGIVHGDIKMENVLVNQNSVVMLADFGMATINDHACRDRHYMGTIAYSAPEMFWRYDSKVCMDLNQHYQKRDIFALGVLVCEVLQGRQPFGKDRRDKASLKYSIINDPPNLLPTLSPQCADFIKLCLHKNPFRRPDCWQLLFHPWVRDHALDKEQYRIIRARARSEDCLPRSVSTRSAPMDHSIPNFLTPRALETFAPTHADHADEALLKSIAHSIAYSVSGFVDACAATPEAHAADENEFAEHLASLPHGGGGSAAALRPALAPVVAPACLKTVDVDCPAVKALHRPRLGPLHQSAEPAEDLICAERPTAFVMSDVEKPSTSSVLHSIETRSLTMDGSQSRDASVPGQRSSFRTEPQQPLCAKTGEPPGSSACLHPPIPG